MNAQAHVSAAVAASVAGGGDSRELAFLREVDGQLQRVKDEHPDWYHDYEDIDPFTAERAFVEHLLQTAPDEFTRGLVTGMLLIRQQIAAVSGRGF